MTGLAVIGCSGSIGGQTLAVARRYPERFKICALAVNSDIDFLIRAAREFGPEVICARNPAKYSELKSRAPEGCEVVSGAEGVRYAATLPRADTVMLAVSGDAGFITAYDALNAGKTLALANKESLVAGGELLAEAALAHGGKIIPVDSEHSAIFQCLQGAENRAKRIILTASGGPFRGYTAERLKGVTPEAALAHPVWKMGKKITVDSATMMNKGLEIIEAYRLFGIVPDYVIHPQSIIHSMVEFEDNAVLAQLGLPTMEIPIQYALTYPERLKTTVKQINFTEAGKLEFFEPDEELFPCPKIAGEALAAGGLFPAVMCAANEAAADAFLSGLLPFCAIPGVIRDALSHGFGIAEVTAENIVLIAKAAKEYTYRRIKECAYKP
ncbi:MAG: 1-deoxy-D-xylulose-5-phosphate reductoisomerase [Clostridiales bacterium]|jgi:1-deoxy-D-xylulose-5-phosphate reductoisomerase|nr:1-deoxy-D-xylulose-5-phosphate reductoisomerase [Clostridiales bacterium]